MFKNTYSAIRVHTGMPTVPPCGDPKEILIIVLQEKN